MRLDLSGERIMACVAHPDDAELLCAGTLARACIDGAEIAIACLCRGDRGQPDPPIPDLAARRREEMQQACDLLQAECFPGFASDGQLADNADARRAVIDRLRAFRPTLVITHSPTDYHADHQATSNIVEAATWFAASRGHETTCAPLDTPPALWFADSIGMLDFTPDLWIDVTPHVELKHDMLRCHASQLARGEEAGFSPLEETMKRQYSARGEQAGVQAAEAFRWSTKWKRIASL